MTAAALGLVAAAGGIVGAQNAPPVPNGPFALLFGMVVDSIHGEPLAHATVMIEGSGRSALTTAEGEYRIDSIPPGRHRVLVKHPLLDTIGKPILSPEYPLEAGKAYSLNLATSSGAALAADLCTSGQRFRGPALMFGFVRDPTTGAPATGSKVSLVYYETDLIGRKQLRVSEVPVDSTGRYRICGLPADMSGKVQVFRNGISSGEVPAAIQNGVLVRSFSIVAEHEAVAVVKDDSGRVTTVAKGSARVSGVVVDKAGKPLVGARVGLQGGGGASVAITGAAGEFALDSLPAGTQALDVRKLGYAAAEVGVELSPTTPARKRVTMEMAPTLAPVRVEAQRISALAKIGYEDRKKTGMGYFLDGDRINHQSGAFSNVIRTVPGFRADPTGDGRTYTIVDTRSASNGCVNYYLDGFPFPSLTPGDIDQYVRPDELVAIEAYHGSEAPPRFSAPGQSGCAVLVIWTVAKVRPDEPKKRP